MLAGTDYRDLAGFCGAEPLTGLPGDLTVEQRTELQAVAEEQKSAHDLFASFADRDEAAVFTRLARADTRHLTAVRSLLARYGINDPTAGLPTGRFARRGTQQRYDRLLASGAAGRAAALRVGRDVTRAHLAALCRGLTAVTAADVREAYGRLALAAQQDLRTFDAWSTR